MPRNMSFSLTTEQVRRREKTVTRRRGWWFLKSGEILNAVEKCQGLRRGEHVKRICQIRVISTRPERLLQITQNECDREGFPQWTALNFIHFFCEHNKCLSNQIVNRIEFEYVDDPPVSHGDTYGGRFGGTATLYFGE